MGLFSFMLRKENIVMKDKKPRVYILEGDMDTVGNLIELLTHIPKDYKVSLCGMNDISIAVDDTERTILIDDSTFIETHIDEWNVRG